MCRRLAFLGIELHCCVFRLRKLSDLMKSVFICVVKMNESFMGVEGHEGEKLMTKNHS